MSRQASLGTGLVNARP